MAVKGRPEILWPLFGALTGLDGIGPKTAETLVSAGTELPRDILYTLPHSGIDRQFRATIRAVQAPAIATVEVLIGKHMPPANKGRPYRITVEDSETSFQLVFFHAREDWLKRQLPTGQRRIISGKIELFDGVAQMVHPEHMVQSDAGESIPKFEPVYPLHGKVAQKTMWKATRSALNLAPKLPEWIDTELLRSRTWPSWNAAMEQAHNPTGIEQINSTDPARERLAYDELFAHQLTLALARAQSRKAKGRSTIGDGVLRGKVLAVLPYKPTSAQVRVGDEIAEDMAAPERMNRLLQGDVGSGKTIVAMMALLTAVEADGQGVMMAPTEILARQHLEGLQTLAESAGVVLELLTGRDKGAERKVKLAALAEGKIQILVGTHAVFQKDVNFHDLRLAVVDEQHRFGVAQRMELGAKGTAVDVLVMTATPIPRSLALAQYGDMDISVLDEKPPGRMPVQTALVATSKMDQVIARLQAAVAEGRQCFWVCPLVEESEVIDMTAAQDRFQRLRAVFGDGVVGLVHGQLPSVEKDAAMALFIAGETKVLVATTVIEVGVNVPNASIMVIERAESFGLAQLHQLRGRVGRGDAQSTCLMLYQSPLSETGRRRLEILRATEDGFQIAEEDLAMRGAGDVIGTAQSGLPRFHIADLERQAALMEIAQTDARKLLLHDVQLTSDRGMASRNLLWLMQQDRAIRLLSVG